VAIEPGTVVGLEGRNGAGKSTAMEAIKTGITGKNQGISVRDGQSAGTVKLPGVTVRIGARISKSGKASHSFVLMEDGGQIGTLIDPGIKSPESADKKRLEALLEICKVDGSKLDVQGFLGENLYAEMLKADAFPAGAVDRVAALKRWLDKEAREYESDVAEATGGIEQIGELPEVGADVPDTEAARLGHLALYQKYSAALLKRQAADEALVSIDEASGDLADVDVLQGVLDERAARIADLQTQIDDLIQRQNVLHQQQIVGNTELVSVRKQKSNYDRLRAKIDDAQSPNEILALADRVGAANNEYEDRVSLKKSLESAVELRARLLALKVRRERSEHLGAECRAKAKGTSSLLQQAVGDIEGWVVREGDLRLCVQHSRGVITFSELSPGEKAIRALQLVVGKLDFPEGFVPVVLFPQEEYEALDEDNKAEVLGFAKDRGLCIVTARPTCGDVHAAVLS